MGWAIIIRIDAALDCQLRRYNARGRKTDLMF